MQILIKSFLFIFCLFLTGEVFPNSTIKGNIAIDSTWNTIVYLSIISNFDQLNSMSNQMIIDKTAIDKNGNFCFETNYLPAENYIYRIHSTKKGDPPASLIIGGKDENHLFFIANNKTKISIHLEQSETLFGNIEFANSPQSQLINEIDKMLLFVDTTSFSYSSLKRELVENALDEKLRQFADTCSFPLVALYAVYKSNFERNISENPNFYLRFLEKWKDEKSPYFEEFRKSIPLKKPNRNYSFLFGIIGLFLGVILTFFLLKMKSKKPNPIQELTIQERKIFTLLQNGKSNKEISDEFNISLSTVKSHVNNIFSKLDIKSRKEVLELK